MLKSYRSFIDWNETTSVYQYIGRYSGMCGKRFERKLLFRQRQALWRTEKHADCYNDLLKALPFIDGIGKDNVYDGWDDEEFISIQGMNKAKAFNNLEERFHIYIRETLKLLDKNVLWFLLMILIRILRKDLKYWKCWESTLLPGR